MRPCVFFFVSSLFSLLPETIYALFLTKLVWLEIFIHMTTYFRSRRGKSAIENTTTESRKKIHFSTALCAKLLST